MQLRGVALHPGEEVVDVLPLRPPIGDDEAVVAQQIDGAALVAGELVERRVVALADAIEQRRDIRRDQQLRVGERVHQEHFVPLGQRHTKIED